MCLLWGCTAPGSGSIQPTGSGSGAGVSNDDDTGPTDDTDSGGSGDDDTGGSGSGSGSGGSGSETDVLEERTPQWTAQEVADIVSAVLTDSLPNTLVLAQTYLDIMGRGDDDCPGSANIILAELDGCTSESGVTYIGVGHLDRSLEDTEVMGVAGQNWFMRSQIADFQMLEPEGEAFYGGGSILYKLSTYEDGYQFGSMDVEGTWQYTNAEQAWLRDGISAYLTSSAVWERPEVNPTPFFNLNGSLGLKDANLFFDFVTVQQGGCNTISDGTIYLRQDDGSWNALAFDDSCTGCASVTWDGTEELGEGCLDYDPSGYFAQWESEPW